MRDPAELSDYIDQVSASVGLSVAPEHREAVAAALAGLLDQGEKLLAFPLDETIEPAPHYAP